MMRASAYGLAFLLCWSTSPSLLSAADEVEKPAATKAAPSATAPTKSAVKEVASEEAALEREAAPAKVKPATTDKPAAAEAAPAKSTTAAAAPAPTKISPDELAIRRNVQQFTEAFEARDAAKLAGLWAPNAIWVNNETGDRVVGREAIMQNYTTMFEHTDPAKLKVQIQSIHFTTPTVAVEDGTATVIRGEEDLKTTAYTAIHVLVDGKWYVDSIRETDLPPAPTAQEELSQLDWLVGSWIDQSDEATVTTRYHWTPNRNFLVQSFSVMIGDDLQMQGTQIIGWDPSRKQIRSWLFDSEGGFSEGSWEAEENRWVIRQASTLPDGRHGSSLNVLTRMDDDSFTFKSSAREIEGMMLPNVEEFTVVRQADDESLTSVEEEPSHVTE